MHSVFADLQLCASDHAHQLVEVHVQLQSDFLLAFALVSVPNGWDHMHAHSDMHVVEFPYM